MSMDIVTSALGRIVEFFGTWPLFIWHYDWSLSLIICYVIVNQQLSSLVTDLFSVSLRFGCCWDSSFWQQTFGQYHYTRYLLPFEGRKALNEWINEIVDCGDLPCLFFLCFFWLFVLNMRCFWTLNLGGKTRISRSHTESWTSLHAYCIVYCVVVSYQCNHCRIYHVDRAMA